MLFLRVTKYYSTSSIYNSLLNPNKLCSTFRFSVMLTPIKIPYNLFSPMQDEKYLLFLKSRTLPCILLLASISWSIQFPLPGLPGFSVFTLWPVTHVFSHRAATASSLLKCFPHHQTRTLSLSPENPPQFPTHTTLTDDHMNHTLSDKSRNESEELFLFFSFQSLLNRRPSYHRRQCKQFNQEQSCIS